MTRRMSCSMTVEAVVQKTKTETRRDPATWKNLRPGDHLVLVEKAMGLPKGATQRVLTEVVVTVNEVEMLGLIDDAGVAREGFPRWDGDDVDDRVSFMRFWLAGHGHRAERMSLAEMETAVCRRIAWRYLDDEPSP